MSLTLDEARRDAAAVRDAKTNPAPRRARSPRELAADRFARASFLLSAIPRQKDKNYIQGVPEQSFTFQAVASVMSVMRAVSVPLSSLGVISPITPLAVTGSA